MKNKNSPLISDKNEEELPHKGVWSQHIAVTILKCLLNIVSTLPGATAPFRVPISLIFIPADSFAFQPSSASA